MSEASLRFAAFLAAFGVVAAWEIARPRRRLAEPRRRRWPTNLGLALLDALALRILLGGALFSAAAFAAERDTGILHWMPVAHWQAAIVTLLGLDFAVYLQHLLFHAVPALWRVHRVHHADLGFDVTTGLRFHPIEMLVSLALKSAAVLLLGATPGAVVAFEILLNASSLFDHGNVAIPGHVDRRLRWMVVTPDMHRIHHSSRAAENGSNFGFSFPWWDRLCGTYRREPLGGELGSEIGLPELRAPLRLAELLALPFRGTSDRYRLMGTSAQT